MDIYRSAGCDRIFEAVAADRDIEWLSIDASVIRAHAQAASGRRKGEPQAQALGLPVRFALGPGQRNDMAPACDLIRGRRLPAHQVIADKAYDAGSPCELVLEQGGEPVIPPPQPLQAPTSPRPYRL